MLLRLGKPLSFLFPFLLFAFLCVVRLGGRPYFGDEISAIEMTRGSLGQTIEAVGRDVHPPVYFVLLKGFRSIVGERGWALRLLSAVFAIAAFPFLWAIATRFFGRSAAIPVWLLATSSFTVFASRFIRYYSLGLLESAAATYLLLLLLERPSRRLWIAYGAVIVLSLYTFYLSVIIMAAHAIVFYVAWRREPRRLVPPLIVLAAACFLFIPWATVLARQVEQLRAAETVGGILTGTATQIVYTLYAFAAGDSISPFALPFSAAMVVFYAVLSVYGVRMVWRNRSTRSLAVPAMAGLALAVPAAMRLAGMMHEPAIFLPVRLLFAAPFFIMIIACGLLAIGDRRVRGAALAVALAIQAFSLYNYYFNRQWTNWAYAVPMPEIIAHVEKNVRSKDLVIFDEWNLARGPNFYWRGTAPVWRFGPEATRWPGRLDSADRIWIVRAVRDRSPGGQVDKLFSYLQRNFVLKQQNAYVKDPPAIYVQKRRWLHREVYPHKVESLMFVRPIPDLESP